MSDLPISQRVNAATDTKTSRGTPIRKPGQELDKNAFLRILSAELSNQDPMNAKDGTEFVSQMAQFSSLEQMANLNGTMRFMGASSLIGKAVMLNRADEKGNLYMGKVTGVSKDGDNIKINVVVGEAKNDKGETVAVIKQFNIEDIIELINMPSGDSTNPEVPGDGENGGENTGESAGDTEESKVE